MNSQELQLGGRGGESPRIASSQEWGAGGHQHAGAARVSLKGCPADLAPHSPEKPPRAREAVR